MLVTFQRGQGPSFEIHDPNRGVRVGDEQVRREALVLADLCRVVQRVAQVSITETVAHIFHLT